MTASSIYAFRPYSAAAGRRGSGEHFLRAERTLFVATRLIIVALALCSSFTCGAASSKVVLAHYMPWYEGKPYSQNWGWHWTMNHYNPDNIGPDGRRPVASRYYPLIGPYDSADPVALEYHVLLMKLAGIDGVIVDWYGMDNYFDYAVNDQRTKALLKWTQMAGLKFSLCYEDQTIKHEIDGGFVTAAKALEHAQQTMLYAETNYFSASGYLRWNAEPVLLNFGPQYFKSSSDWDRIFSVLAASNRPAFFTEDNRLEIGAGAFDWPPMWMSQTNGGQLVKSQLEAYLNTFEQKASSGPCSAFVSSAFPRFHDIYQQAGAGTSYGELEDRNGDTLRETLSRSFTNSSALVQIVTWNDYGEGTIVEPTAEFGYRDLGIIQDLRRQYLDPSFARRTNDLALATRVYNLRRACEANSVVPAELNQIFTNIVSGNLARAEHRLKSIEARQPVRYDGKIKAIHE